MSQLNSNQTEELRHERKFSISDYSALEVEQIIKYNPACFSEIYHPRQINNIYFDSLGYTSYYENVDGERDRVKARIRWYGQLFGSVQKPILEFKIKNGLLGKKDFFELAPFHLDESFSKQTIVDALKNERVPLDIRNTILAMQPSLLNSYVRKYFISADKNFRLTIDTQLQFYRISYNQNLFIASVVDHKSVVLELKYDSQYENEAKEIGSRFPFSLTKNSKYLQGVEKVLF